MILADVGHAPVHVVRVDVLVVLGRAGPPRVVEQFGLDYESLAALRPDVIAVRMPGFGLDGPWRDYVGWALNIEQVSGMSAVTGYAQGPPVRAGPRRPHRRCARRGGVARRARPSSSHR